MRRGWMKLSIVSLLFAVFFLIGRHLNASAPGSDGAAEAAAPDRSGGAPPKAIDPSFVPPSEIGMNLGTRAYWSTEWPFNDLVQDNGALKIVRPDGWHEITDQVQMDATGHPINVPKGTQLIVHLLAENVERLPVGTFDCHISPGWTVEANAGDGVVEGGGNTSFRVLIRSPKREYGVALRLDATASAASLTQMSCVFDSNSKGLLNAAFVNDLKPFRIVRFMEVMQTNNNPPRTWAQRATPAEFSQVNKGISVEYLVSIANEARVDPWFNMPLDADEDYWRNYAIYVRDHVAPDRKIYVELSNEVWNTGFPQGQAAIQRGKAAYPGVDEPTASDYYYADRVKALMRIWSDVFKGQEKRLVRVLATQAVWKERIERTVAHGDVWRSVDLVVTAPYFGTNGEEGRGTGADRVNDILSHGAEHVDAAIRQAKMAKAIAAKYGLPYGTYEAGPGYQSYNAALVDDLKAVSLDPRMYDIYKLFLTRWRKEVGGPLVVYSSIQTPGPGGTYGHRAYTGQPIAEAPKMRAIVDTFGASH